MRDTVLASLMQRAHSLRCYTEAGAGGWQWGERVAMSPFSYLMEKLVLVFLCGAALVVH